MWGPTLTFRPNQSMAVLTFIGYKETDRQELRVYIEEDRGRETVNVIIRDLKF